MTTRPDPHSYPPLGMSRDEAARWVGVGATLFDELVRDGRMPKPARINGRTVWSQYKLTAAFHDLDEAQVNVIDAAFAKVVDKRPGRAA